MMIKIHPLEGLIKQYLEEKDITPGTKDLFQTILKQYLHYLSENDILYAHTEDVLQFREINLQRGCSSRWVYHQISVLKGLYRFLSLHQVRLGIDPIYAFNIMEPIKNEPFVSKKTKPILSAVEAKQLLLYLKDHRRYTWHYRDYAMIYLMITSGLRSIEIRRARIKDLQMIQGSQILYIQGKGRSSADEFVKISPGVNRAIKEYLAIRKDQNPYLFVSKSKKSKSQLSRTIFHNIFTRVLRDAGLEATHITAHSLRHTAATLNFKRGATLEETKKLLRHAEMSNTLIYTHDTGGVIDQTVIDLEKYITEKNEVNIKE